MDYKQLDYFLSVAEEKSFSKASQRCFISQQALSKAVNNLEKELDCTLFTRGSSGIELTAAGRKLRKHAIAYVQYHDKILTLMQKAESESVRPFTLGFATGMMEQFSEDFLSRFIMRYPEVQFKVVSYPDDSYNRSLRNYELDVSLCSMLPNPEKVKILYHYKHRAFLLTGKNHPLACKPQVTTQDLRDVEFVTMNNDTKLVADVDLASQQFQFKNQIFISPSEYELCYQLLLTGRYASLYATHYRDSGHQLVKKEIEDLNIEYHFYIITQKDTVVTPLMEDLVAAAKAELEKPL